MKEPIKNLAILSVCLNFLTAPADAKDIFMGLSPDEIAKKFGGVWENGGNKIWLNMSAGIDSDEYFSEMWAGNSSSDGNLLCVLGGTGNNAKRKNNVIVGEALLYPYTPRKLIWMSLTRTEDGKLEIKCQPPFGKLDGTWKR